MNTQNQLPQLLNEMALQCYSRIEEDPEAEKAEWLEFLQSVPPSQLAWHMNNFSYWQMERNHKTVNPQNPF